ncbi:MAG: O-antigen ligase family protein [Gammaproteobacteria bacterium]|nr:O-antigen ligase family protein [Gammaproteobacteria bacterium]
MYKKYSSKHPEALSLARRVPLLFITASCLLAVNLTLFPDFIPLPFGGYADQRFLLVVLIGVLSISPIISLGEKLVVRIAESLILLPMLAFCLSFVGLAAPFRAQAYAWVEPGMYAFYFMASLMSGAFLAWSGLAVVYARFLVLSVAAGCLFYGLASLNVYWFAIYDGVTKLQDFIPWGFVNIRYWSHIATWCLPLMPLAVLIGKLKNSRSWRAFVLLGSGIWWWILYLTTSRGSAIGLFFGVILTVLLFGRRCFPWLRIFFIYAGVGFVIWLLLTVLVPDLLFGEGLQLRNLHAGDSGRLTLFIEAWRMSLQEFPLGMGPQSWLTHESFFEDYYVSRKFGHPHNMYLMWAAEYGWLLIGVLGLVVVQAVRYFWVARRLALLMPDSQSNNEKVLILVAITASLSGALFHAGVSAIFMAPGSMLIGLFVLIGFWALVLPVGKTPHLIVHDCGTLAAFRVLFLALSLILFACWLVWAQEVWAYYLDMREDEELYFKEGGAGALPRFWFHGNFPR